MTKSFEEQTAEAVTKAQLLNADVLSMNDEELEKHPMRGVFHLAHNMFKTYHIVNDIGIAAAVHDAKNDKEKGGNSLEGLDSVKKVLSALGEEKVTITAEMQKDYQELKAAVYDTHVLGVGKNMKEKTATVMKNAVRVATSLISQAFNLTGESLKLAGNLVKLAPICWICSR